MVARLRQAEEGKRSCSSPRWISSHGRVAIAKKIRDEKLTFLENTFVVYTRYLYVVDAVEQIFGVLSM